MRSKEIILNEIDISLRNEYTRKAVFGVLVPTSYIDRLKLEYVCSCEGTTIEEVLGNVVRRKVEKFESLVKENGKNENNKSEN